ncbi:MAG: betaine/proline/choline family ABC transporter ATP-binding protein [Desulfobacterales bacterium]|nr:betaine/proline/choline family ABC transporter ATP-binding protein [Desulfobacterales bacterium]
MIEFERVTKIYPGSSTPAVDAVTFTIPDGEICTVIGPSGCGKTTIMRMINRLHPITSGTIRVSGKDVNQMDEIELRRGIGYAIQQVGLFPHMTVRDNIATVPKLLGWDKAKIDARVDELLDLVNLEPATYRHRYPKELSGGQAQRIGVARAMATDPPVMLMDEPFGAIDPINREVLQDEFLKIQERLKKTIVFVTHDIDEAVKMGDKICLLEDGRLVQFASPEDMRTRPKNRFVKDFVGADRTLKRLNLLKVNEVMVKDPLHCQTHQRCDDVLEFMQEEGIRYLLVTDRDGIFKGFVYHEFLVNHEGIIEDVVQDTRVTVKPTANVKDALSKMLSWEIGVLTVADENGKLLGVLNSATLHSVVGETYDEFGGHWNKIRVGGRIL